MFLGIIVFSAYFIDIQYFPVNNLASILYLPVIAGLTGFVLLICFAGLIGSAPYMWSELLKNKNICHRIVGNENTEHVMCAYKAGYVDLDQKCRMQIFKWFISVMFFCVSLWTLASLQKNNIFLLAFLIIGFAGKYWVLLTQEKSNYYLIYSFKNNKISFLWDIAIITCYSFIPSLTLFIAILGLVNLCEIKETLFQFSFAFVVIFTTSICLLPFSKNWKLLNWTAIVSISSIISLIALFGIFTNLSANIVHLFKFGNIKNASIIVDEIGCDIFKLNGFKIECLTTQKRYKIDEVNVLWRANEYYIQDFNNPTIKFIFSEKHAPSISIPEQNKSMKLQNKKNIAILTKI